MLKHLILFVFALGYATCFGQSDGIITPCAYCTSVENALLDPEMVTHLDLSAQGLNKLPDGLEKLPNLKSLDLSDNLIDEVDFEKYSWPFLEELDVSNNPGFNTVELAGLGSAMPRLKLLNLKNCSAQLLSSAISELRELKELDLSNNAFIYLPSEMDKLKKLQILNVNNNSLTNVDFLTNLWALTQLDISGNDELNLRDLSTAFYFKPTLDELIVSPSERLRYGLPKSFGDISVANLVLKDAELNQIESRLMKNKELRKLTLENITVDDPKRFVGSVNRIAQIEVLEFKNMTVPSMIDKITTIDELGFEYCEFEDLSELKKVKPTIDIAAVGTNISHEGYIGNTQVAKMGTRNEVTQIAEPVRLNEAMLENEVEPIVVPETQEIKILGDTPCIVKTESSEFAIPKDAFLNSNGEVYSGEVEIKVIEYMDPVMNALSGAPMVYQSEQGTEVFASSGMMDFRAYDDNGNELQANPESIIQVEMNDVQPAETSNFYTYNDEANNWEVAPLPRPSNFMEAKQKILDSINLLTAEEVTGFKVVPLGMFLKYKKSRRDPYSITFSSKGRTRRIKRIRGEAGRVYTANPEQKWMAKRKTWKIDTVISDDMKGLLASIKKDQRKVRKYWKRKAMPRFEYSPRIIRDLTIEPNLEQDNYSMIFGYRDSTYRIPVILSLSGSVTSIQAKEKRHFRNFQKLQRYGDKERKVIDEYRAKELRQYADMRRYMIRNSNALNADFQQAQQEYNRFGLSSFGMVNCDYFFRNVPDGYIAFDSVGVDLEGETVEVPRDVRSIFLSDNVYVSSTSLDIPIYNKRKSILFFLISSVEIGIVKGWEVLSSGFVRPEVERVSIDGVSPEEVKQKIMRIGK